MQHVNFGSGAVEDVVATWALWAGVTRDSTGVFVKPRCLLDHRADVCVVLLQTRVPVVHRFYSALCVGLFVVSER